MRVLLLFVCASLSFAQTLLTNDSIIKMVKAGLGDDIVVSTINAQTGKYDTGPDQLIALKGLGISDKVIGAMVTKMASGGGAPAASAAPAATAAPVAPAGAAGAPMVAEVGVYYKKNDQWTDLPPEVVNFKTGGVLKSIGTAGIVK